MQRTQHEWSLTGIKKTIEHRLYTAFIEASGKGLTLDDLVRITGLEKNSISGVRSEMEKAGTIRRGEPSERQWNKKKTRKQNVYFLCWAKWVRQ